MAGAGKADGRTECDEGQILLKFVLPEPVHDEVDVMLHRRVRPPQPTASARLFKSGTTKGRPQSATASVPVDGTSSAQGGRAPRTPRAGASPLRRGSTSPSFKKMARSCQIPLCPPRPAAHGTPVPRRRAIREREGAHAGPCNARSVSSPCAPAYSHLTDRL